jgi:hypothetical protein
LPVPPAGLKVSQNASSIAVHEVFELTAKLLLPASAVTSQLSGETDSVIIPFWVTLTCCITTPAPVMVIVAVLASGSVFVVKVAIMVASPMPDAGFNVNQVASEVKAHDVLELIAKLVLPASASTTLLEGETDRIYMPFCVTVTCCEAVPEADTVMTAILAVEDVFAVNEAVKVPLPPPAEGLSVSQSASSVIVHEVFELIENVVLPASATTSLL